MTLIAWTDELATRHPQMDATHREFIEHLDRVHAASEAPLDEMVAAYDALLAHTVEHFAQEDRWMQATGFSPDNCHSMQHSQVLGVLRDVRRQVVEDGRREIVAQLLPELVQWFEGHAQMADAGLAHHIGEVGYDTATGQIRTPVAAASVSGCGTTACADA
jgi:hemerythrin-like metal-binding protein